MDTATRRADLPPAHEFPCFESVGKYVITASEVGDKEYHLNISINLTESNEKPRIPLFYGTYDGHE